MNERRDNATPSGAGTPLWTPDADWVASSALVTFAERIHERYGVETRTYRDLHAWSIARPDQFWSEVWDFCGVIGERGERTIAAADTMTNTRFFPDARLNFAENLLRGVDDDALVFRNELGEVRRLNGRELTALVSRLARAMTNDGIGVGDRVVALLPNCPEAVFGMLAATAIGATWSSCSPDFGVEGVLDRFGQLEPVMLLTCDAYTYGGKPFDCLEKSAAIAARLPSLRRVIVIEYDAGAHEAVLSLGSVTNAVTFGEYLDGHTPGPIQFAQLSFSHPLYILFSSGTTGAPKCIVHSVGGTLLQHLKEHRLQTDIRPADRLFYFTTCTWMMWNWLVSGLASGATVLLYEGSPFHGNDSALLDFAAEERATHFGVSAKYLDTLRKLRLKTQPARDLSALRWILSTGSPLVAESFDFVYRNIKSDVYLASISGGTDIVSTFVCGSPLSPVYRGEIPAPGLGMAVEVWNENGARVVGEKGELVCTRAFPSLPIGFLNDDQDAKFRAAYFERYPGVWAQGDFAEETHHGGFVIYGRSDATLNPGGVRIGSAEIYRQVEHFDAVTDSLVIGQSMGDDVRIVLFVVLIDGQVLDDALREDIKRCIRINASPRHVPAKIIQVDAVPRTRSGKLTELAVRNVIEGREVTNREALQNPEALDQFRHLPDLDD